jgi:hypothetical protein
MRSLGPVAIRLAVCAGLTGMTLLVLPNEIAGAAAPKTVACGAFLGSTNAPAWGRLKTCSGTGSSQTGATGTWNLSESIGATITWQTHKTTIFNIATHVVTNNCAVRTGARRSEKAHLSGPIVGGSATHLVGGRFNGYVCFYTRNSDGSTFFVNDGALKF